MCVLFGFALKNGNNCLQANKDGGLVSVISSGINLLLFEEESAKDDLKIILLINNSREDYLKIILMIKKSRENVL